MKSLYVFLAGFLVFSLISYAQTEKELLLDSFEGELNSRTVDFGAGDDSLIEVDASTELKVCGAQSMKIKYDLKPGGYIWIVRRDEADKSKSKKEGNIWLVNPRKIDWEKYDALSLQMYGRKSNAIITFGIKDVKGEIWRFIILDDFKGWKEVVCPFSQFYAHRGQQPQNAEFNKILDFPIKSFLIEPNIPGEGVYYFDCVKLIKVEK